MSEREKRGEKGWRGIELGKDIRIENEREKRKKVGETD